MLKKNSRMTFKDKKSGHYLEIVVEHASFFLIDTKQCFFSKGLTERVSPGTSVNKKDKMP